MIFFSGFFFHKKDDSDRLIIMNKWLNKRLFQLLEASWIPIKLWREERVISSSASRYHINHVYHVCYIILGLTFLYFNIWKNWKIGEKDSLRIFLMLVHICIVPKVILLIICTNCTELRETQIVEWIDREFVQRYPFNVTPLL